MLKTETAYFEAAAGRANQLLPSDCPEIAFSGRSNVGKSSLINRLLNRKALARTSATPGKTATVNFYRAGAVRLADLPGYGYAKVAQSERLRWAELMEGYFQSGRNIRLVVQLVDMRHAPSREDVDMLDFLAQTGRPFVLVLTKADKLNQTQRRAQTQFYAQLCAERHIAHMIPFSAETGEGAAELKQLLHDACMADEKI